jgi:hypothetical protein
MTDQRFHAGAFVFTRARGLTPRDPDDLPPLAAAHGIDPTFVPEYAGDRVAIGRAITQASSGLQREGVLLRPIRRTSTEILYGIVREQKDEAEQRLDHEFEATVSWSAEPDPSVVHGDHPIARRVADAYRDLRGKIVADDWSGVITAHLEQHDAARVRGDGRVYWVPPQRVQDVRRLGAFLQEVGIDLVLCELEPEVRPVVEQVAHDSLDEQIAALELEAQEFDGTQKPSTYTRRLDEYQRLRERAVLYRDALGVGVDRAEQVLNELERKVTTMLDLRRQTVVHRDGTTDQTTGATPAPTNTTTPTTLRFAGAVFTATSTDEPETLLFVSDDARAKTSAQMLESMGLAGRWQQAGPAQVAIQNSGPPGAAVSIRVRLTSDQSLTSAVRALAAIGIELTPS